LVNSRYKYRVVKKKKGLRKPISAVVMVAVAVLAVLSGVTPPVVMGFLNGSWSGEPHFRLAAVTGFLVAGYSHRDRSP